jgi:hypothetical protein
MPDDRLGMRGYNQVDFDFFRPGQMLQKSLGINNPARAGNSYDEWLHFFPSPPIILPLFLLNRS